MRKKKLWTIEEIKDLEYMYANGFTHKEISEVTGRCIPNNIAKANEYGFVFMRTFRHRVADDTYICLSCRQFKKKSEFNKTKNSIGIKAECKFCERTRRKEKYLSKKLPSAPQYKSKEEVNGGPIRRCSTCKNELPVENFGWNKTGYKLKFVCKECISIEQARQRLNRIEKRGYE